MTLSVDPEVMAGARASVYRFATIANSYPHEIKRSDLTVFITEPPGNNCQSVSFSYLMFEFLFQF